MIRNSFILSTHVIKDSKYHLGGGLGIPQAVARNRLINLTSAKFVSLYDSRYLSQLEKTPCYILDYNLHITVLQGFSFISTRSGQVISFHFRVGNGSMPREKVNQPQLIAGT